MTAETSPHRPPSAADIIRGRLATGSKPGRREDPWILALAMEGGAMRGVCAGGAAAAIETAGATDAFDLLYGSSAGGCAVAYLCARRAVLGARIFYEDINNTRFISTRAALRGGPLVNVDFLIDEVMTKSKPLGPPDPQGPKLGVTVTEVATGKALLLTEFAGTDELREALRGTARMPLIGGAPVELNGRIVVDGGVASPVPLEQALTDGATHVVCAFTRPRSAPEPKHTWIDRRLIAPRLARVLSEPVAAAYLARSAALAEAIARAKRAERRAGAPVIEGVFAGDGLPEVSRTETREHVLRAASAAGARATAAVLGLDIGDLADKIVHPER